MVETLTQAEIDCEVAPLVDAHGAGRRRITLHARMGTHDVLKVGFAAAGSHDIIPIDRCPILDPALNGALEAAWALAEPLIQSASRSTSRPPQPTTASTSTYAVPDRSTGTDHELVAPRRASIAWPG